MGYLLCCCLSLDHFSSSLDSGHTQDKILISTSPHSPGGIQTTNDGATILKAIGVDNPAAKVLVGECMGGELGGVCF